VGASGSGKTSLARAGLVPALKNGGLDGGERWPILICRPGPDPIESLAVALAADSAVGKKAPAVAELMRQLIDDQRTLHLTTRLALHDAADSRCVLLLIDQFEELFTLCDDHKLRQATIDNLLYASGVAAGRTMVVLTMRADFYGKCSTYPGLAAALWPDWSGVAPRGRLESMQRRAMPWTSATTAVHCQRAATTPKLG
jgi:hypothetical protein